jgi:hypothetical protein
MQEINELENKYLVIKRDDLRYLGLVGTQELDRICTIIQTRRQMDGKQQNSYVVLNMEDMISIPYLLENIPTASAVNYDEDGNLEVKDLAVMLVNAILHAES